MRRWPLLLIPVLTLASAAQNNLGTKRAATTVTGHVYCADTNVPARMASVMLEPVRVVDEEDLPNPPSTFSSLGK
jgi:hypothetical protein